MTEPEFIVVNEFFNELIIEIKYDDELFTNVDRMYKIFNYIDDRINPELSGMLLVFNKLIFDEEYLDADQIKKSIMISF